MKAFILFILIITLSLQSSSQNPWELGMDYMMPIGKGYKSNIIGPRYENYNNKTSFNIGLTYHFSSNDVYGGFKGFGIYGGLRYSLGNNSTGSNPFIGARLLFSFENFEGKTNLNSLFFTPLAEAGYHFIFGKHFFTSPAIGYGYSLKITKEYNSREDDEGGRVIPAVSAGFRF